MTLLHELFNARNIQGFQRLLDASIDRRISTAASSSSPTGSKSWTRSGGFISMDVNARDSLGRTVLHLASSSLESIEYVRALLKHPNIDLNLMDSESHWTALHRALYSANLPAALLLLQRSDIDTSLKDVEGYTAFDLYNSTVNGTKPDATDLQAELYTWGTNRNAALGHGDGDDRTYPDRVVIKVEDDVKKSLQARFSPIFVTQIQMSKLHTALVTSENEGNLHLCGFGSGGRLGQAQYTQYSLKPLSNFPQPIVTLALGQDHTLGLTKSGEVFSWGLNRFSQLGYVVEISTTSIGRHEEPIQAIPKRVVGLLRKEVVIGVAASKNASACWTKETVFTWGTNTGQLGYDKSAQPIQVSPRPVTKFSNTVVDIAMTDTVLAGLLISRHVECIWNDTRHRINFPMHAFPTGIQPYRPPQSVKDSHISKITGCDETIAALSSNGEVFTFSAPPCQSTSSHIDNGSVEVRNRNTKPPVFKPQRVWTLRKTFSSVKDVALGSEGSIIVCTESGHVFVRTRNAIVSSSTNNTSSKYGGTGTTAAGKTPKFERVPFLQRVTRVCANSTGAYGALRVDWEPRAIDVVGNGIDMDLKGIQPYLEFYRGEVGGQADVDTEIPGTKTKTRRQSLNKDQGLSSSMLLHDDDKDDDDAAVQGDITGILELCRILKCEQHMRKAGGGSVQYHCEDGKSVPLPHGADTMVYVQPYGVVFPVHRFVLAARSSVFESLFCGLKAEQKEKMKAGETGANSKEKGKGKEDSPSFHVNLRLLPSKPGSGNGVFKLTRLSVEGCHPLTILIFFWYIYSDELLVIWDQRVGGAEAVLKHLVKLEISPARVKQELQALAVVLHLSPLSAAVDPSVKHAPLPSMRRDMDKAFELVQCQEGQMQGVLEARPFSLSLISSPLAPDVVLELADKDVYCHSVVLRARSPFFASFFNLEDWTVKRWNADGMIRVNMRHLKWHVMQFVLRFMCCGDDIEMFHTLDFVNSVEDLIGFMFEVLAGANELLLDRLVLICSSVILDYVNIYNACYILSDATHYHVQQLIERLQAYITVNLESFLESHILDEIPYTLVKQLAKFVRAKQTEKSPFSRSDTFVNDMMEKHAEWLAKQDLPEPIVRANATRASAGSNFGSSLLKKASFMEKISPPMLGRMKPSISVASPSTQPAAGQSITTPQHTLRRLPLGDDVFIMDEMDTAHSFNVDLDSSPSSSSIATAIPISVPAPAWKASGTTRVDMKAVMAEAAIQSKSAGTSLDPHTPGSNGPRTPQSDQRRYISLVGTPSSPTPNNTKFALKPAGVTLPWRSSPDQAAIRAAPLLSSVPTTPSPSAFTSPTNANPRPSGISSSKPQPSSTQLPAMGPVITPTRQLPSKSGSSSIRSASGGKVWTHPTPEPAVSPSLPASVTSFVAIQHSQQQQTAPPTKDKRSLREIQEEEQALEAEANFLKWWTAEEERVQEEALALAQFQSKTNKQPRKPKQRDREKGQKKSNVTESPLGKKPDANI